MATDPARIAALQRREIKSWTARAFAQKTGGCTVTTPDPEKPLSVILQIPGPRDYTINGETRPSPYAGKTFEVAVNLHADHPVTGPEERDIRFLKVPLHPNIRPDGVTCGELPKWDAKMRLMDIARNIRRILSQPNTEAFASVAARNLIRRGVEAFEEAAKADPAEPVEDEPAAEGADAAAAGGAAGGGAA